MRWALAMLAVLAPPLVAGDQAAAQPAPSKAAPAPLTEKQCVAAGQRLAAANTSLAINTQLVATHFAHTTRRCYVLLTLVAGGSDGTPQTTIRTLYRGESGEVLAIASDNAGARSGTVSDPDYTGAMGPGYDEALGYIDSKMGFD